MNKELLMDYYNDYKENKTVKAFCFFKSFLETDDLCIWLFKNTICISDKKDYDSVALIDDESVLLIYETQDKGKIANIKIALGRVDYGERVLEIYELSQKEKVMKVEQ